MFYEMQLCIDDADKGDYGLLKELFEMLKIHMTNSPIFKKNGLPKKRPIRDKVGCSMLSCSS
jgi:hypothetical protein